MTGSAKHQLHGLVYDMTGAGNRKTCAASVICGLVYDMIGAGNRESLCSLSYIDLLMT